jgi:hypothetical protein
MINKRVVIFIVLSLFVMTLGYYFLNSKTTSNGNNDGGGGDPGNKCKNGADKDGNCIPDSELCNNIRKSVIDCPDGQSLLCDKTLGKWRCKRKCESDSNPFPYKFQGCKPDDVKCDSSGKYYCGSDYCKNGGILLSTGNGICSCPPPFSGDTCECDATKCRGGKIDNPQSCTCSSCCSPDESLDRKCKYYGKNCENKCELDNYVYDYDLEQCVCPPGFIEDKTTNPYTCTPLVCTNGTIANNSCICNAGWTGSPLCNIPICKNGGSFDTSTNKCICLAGTAGNYCEYTRENLCQGNGNPEVKEDGVPKCICDKDKDNKPIWDGLHCSCEIVHKPTEDNCKGMMATCTDSGWVASFETCGKIQDFYGEGDNGKAEWIRQCTDDVLEDKGSYEKGIWAGCRDNSPNASTFYPITTCNATPSDDDLSNCNNVDGCYIPQTGKNADKFNKICVCAEDANGNASYSCRKISNNKECGPRPPPEFCTYDKIPQTPECIQYDGVNSMWACPNSILPKDAARLFYGAKEMPIDRPDVDKRQTWWKRNPLSPEDNGNTIYPTINMDSCTKKPFDRVTYPGDFQPGWNSFESANGFVKNFGKDGEKFYYRDDPRLLVYNVNANVSDNMVRITQDVKRPFPYPSEEDDLMHNTEYNTGCAIEKKEYNEDSFKRGEKQSMCAKALDGTDAGRFVQICADKDGNVVDCITDKSAYFRTDQIKCNCYNTYRSDAQGKDGVNYVGRYCQYNDNTTCGGKGIADYNGNCDCTNTYISNSQKSSVLYKGNNCQYDDNTNCYGKGIVDDNGNCDFNILGDKTKYNLVSSLNSLKDGDLVIIEMAISNISTNVITPTDLYINHIYNTTVKNNYLNVHPTPDVFKIRVYDNGSYQFHPISISNINKDNINNISSDYILVILNDDFGNTAVWHNKNAYPNEIASFNIKPVNNGTFFISFSYNRGDVKYPSIYNAPLDCIITTTDKYYRYIGKNKDTNQQVLWRIRKF